MLYACDAAWWQLYFPEVAVQFAGELWTVSEAARDRYGLQWVQGVDAGGVSANQHSIHTNKNSGAQAIALASLFGATRIVLLGFDMGRINNKTHWHGDHPKPLGNGNRYAAWIRAIDTMAAPLRDAGISVVNCSRHTALKCFERAPLEAQL